MDDAQLAEALASHYSDNAEATVEDAARSLGETQGRVVMVLDSYKVTEDGVEYAGEGGGGGWVPESE